MRIIVLLGACLCVCGSPARPAQTTSASRTCVPPDPLCGPRCLLCVCRKAGIAVDLGELARLCRWDQARGSSLAGLDSAARAKGLSAAALKTGLDQLLALQLPAIVHLWSGHFVVVEAGGADTLVVTDPPGEGKAVAKEAFSKRYSGFALLIAKDASLLPKSEPSGPDLRLDTYTWDFGAANQDIPVERIVKLRNVGNADLVISKVETSCGDCLVPVGGPQTIAAGGEGEMKAMVVTANQRRGVSKELLIHSNDPVSPVVHLAVTGYVRPSELAFSPRSVSLGSPRRTEKASSEVYIPSFEEDRVEVTSVSSSPHLTAEVSESKHKERPGYIITATLKPGAPLGEFKGSITIASNHWKQPKVEIPVTATIRGSIDLSHDSLFLGIAKKGNQKQCAVTISTVSDKPLTIDRIDCSLPYLSAEWKPKIEGKEYTLTATLKPDAPLGNMKGMLTIHTNDPDQPEIMIPVCAYVEEG